MIAGAARDGSAISVPLRRIIPVVVAIVTGRLSKSPREPGIYAWLAAALRDHLFDDKIGYVAYSGENATIFFAERCQGAVLRRLRYSG